MRVLSIVVPFSLVLLGIYLFLTPLMLIGDLAVRLFSF